MEAETVVRPVIEGAGLDLVEVGFRGEGGRRILRVVVDRDGGVDVETIAELSEQVSRRLDLEGFAQGPYALEISSPGIERPLRSPADHRRAVGASVRIKTVAAIDGAAAVTGTLVSADDDGFTVALADGERYLRYGDVASARTVADWDRELKGGAR